MFEFELEDGNKVEAGYVTTADQTEALIENVRNVEPWARDEATTITVERLADIQDE